MSDSLAVTPGSPWRIRRGPASALQPGEPPERWLVAWNGLARQAPWASRGARARLAAAWQQAAGASRQDALASVEAQRSLNRALRERRLSVEAALALAEVLRTSGLAEPLGLEDQPDLLMQAWRLLCGDMLLDNRAVSRHPALALAALSAARAGWQVVLVTPDGLGADALQQFLAAEAEPRWEVTVIPEERRREGRLRLYTRQLVCVPLGVLAMDLLHVARDSGHTAAALRGHIARLGRGGASPTELFPGSHTLVLLQEAGDLFAERALDSVALHASNACASESSLAVQALALSALLQASHHFEVGSAFDLPTLTEQGRQVLAGLAGSRGGLMANVEICQRAVRAALLVSTGWQEGVHYRTGPERVEILDERLEPLLANREIVPGLRTLLDVHAGLEGRHRELVSQARVHALLSGLPRVGGVGRWLPSVAQELDWLHRRPVWRPARKPRPARRWSGVHRLASHEAAGDWVREWLSLQSDDAGSLLLTVEGIAPPASGHEGLPGGGGGRWLILGDAMRDWRYGAMPEPWVTHLAVVLTSDHPAEEWLFLIGERWPALEECRLVVMPSSLTGGSLLTGWWGRLLPRRWQSRRLVTRRITAKRRLMRRDEGLRKMLHFAKD
ncbi:hypothetical protein [Halomonas sp. 3H]|uniref:hypothetical protein n=1 Tax=Halomonas sp. 3H TaxID=2952527 RepID=UPI0020B7EF3D|nr:hypothetical protein [Halomonas sp. 3H]